MRRAGTRLAVFLITPAALVFAVITLVPTIILVYMSLTDWSMATSHSISFIALDNFRRLLGDVRFIYSVKTTVIFSLGAVSIELLVGMGLALFLMRSPVVVRTFIMLPSMITPVVVGLLWKILLNFEGPVNMLLGFLGIPGVAWLSKPGLAMPVIIFVDLWQWSPFMMLIILAGLQRVEGDIIEAAQVDGASGWQTFWNIKLPLTAPTILIAVAIRLIDLLKTFDTPFVMTGGGPGYQTELLTLYAYKSGIANGNIAYSAAMALLIFITAMIIARFLLQKKVFSL